VYQAIDEIANSGQYHEYSKESGYKPGFINQVTAKQAKKCKEKQTQIIRNGLHTVRD
jgi:hypothetical protein